jgi:hypothetical protein
MKALSLLQPWASLLAGGEKRIETRSWKTQERGRIAIHASKAFHEADYRLCYTQSFSSALIRLGFDEPAGLPVGAILGVGSLEDVRPAMDVRKSIDDKEAAFGNYEMGRWAWIFVDLCIFEKPILARGMPGLWDVPASLLGDIERERARS